MDIDIGRIRPTEAAVLMHVSPQFVRVGLQKQLLPIGTAIKFRRQWSYHISEKLLAEYSGKNVPEEIIKIREMEKKKHEPNREQR